jgi:hypothetical protein
VRSTKVAGKLIVAFILVVSAVEAGRSQNSCPYQSGVSSPTGCFANPNPMPIPAQMGGSRMTAASSCRDALTSALASLFSYDDPGCHPVNSLLVTGPHNVKILEEYPDFFTALLRRLSEESNFHGTLYCDASNALILAFRGSVSLIPPLDPNRIGEWFDDWLDTNILQHMSDRPLQYELAETAADLIRKAWSRGDYNDRCGPGQPTFWLAGHSKGGGQAQFAAVRLQLRAVVFNSDIPNPIIFTDWMYARQTNWFQRHAQRLQRRVQSLLGCQGPMDRSWRPFVTYFASGRIKDVRMVNDPLTQWLLPACANLPHAPIEWLGNTSTCSSNDGHGIDTVYRELQACR